MNLLRRDWVRIYPHLRWSFGGKRPIAATFASLNYPLPPQEATAEGGEGWMEDTPSHHCLDPSIPSLSSPGSSLPRIWGKRGWGRAQTLKLNNGAMHWLYPEF
ncbi:hypothetical protein CDAR_620731 [Caerostris darwini]|uniref:Uncharacterized protein n=1 Tax=Caerostris darwini TaxID=1538125 RepID=A0AAV4URP1_9ARAC|nr:hypothetical protein CDAR_620731 [Caerostris darwini]